MNYKAFLNAIVISAVCSLTGCDYIEKANLIDDLAKQQEQQKSKIEALEKQQQQYKSKLELFEKQQITILNSTRTLTDVVKVVKINKTHLSLQNLTQHKQNILF